MCLHAHFSSTFKLLYKTSCFNNPMHSLIYIWGSFGCGSHIVEHTLGNGNRWDKTIKTWNGLNGFETGERDPGLRSSHSTDSQITSACCSAALLSESALQPPFISQQSCSGIIQQAGEKQFPKRSILSSFYVTPKSVLQILCDCIRLKIVSVIQTWTWAHLTWKLEVS